jgi:inhibitor of KinA
MSEYKVLPAGDTALVVEFGETIDRGLSTLVLALAQRLSEADLAGIVETVPTFRSLMVHYDPLVLPAAALIARIGELMQSLRAVQDPGRAEFGRTEFGRTWHLPTCYDAQVAPDLDAVAARTGLSPGEVVARHSAVTYHVYMLGFLPGQAYMGDVPAELALPRRETPRLKIPAGSLAIASTMTCIFPQETPCGWHLIGRSPVVLWERGPAQGALLAPGDKVSFTPVSLREYEILSAKAAQGLLKIVPSNAAIGAAA